METVTSEHQARAHGSYARIFSFIVAVAVAAVEAGSAPALDQPLIGRKLVLSTTPRLVLVSKDPGINITGAHPPCSGADSVLVMDDGVTSTTFVLPCINWRANSSDTVFKYRNPSAPFGVSPVQAVKIKAGQLKVISRGLGNLSVPNGSATINVMLSLDGITHRYCMSLSGTGDGSRFVARNAPAAGCPHSTPCAANTGGLCWYLGIPHASCDAACAVNGRTYDPATATYAGSGGSNANCGAVLDALGAAAGAVTDTSPCFDGVGCFNTGVGRFRCTSPPTNATAASSVQRVCACQ